MVRDSATNFSLLPDVNQPPRALRFLFVPVSGRYGKGEYARSLAIAQAASARWPEATIHFVLSRQAPYAADVPFPTTLLAASPTFHSAAVIELFETWQPDVVIFDNAGRTAQLRAAQRLGARVVYISARRRQRRKAFRWRWMAVIDEHWIAYPKFLASELNFLERLKLKLIGRPVVRYLDVILSRGDTAQGSAILSRIKGSAGRFVLIVPGGGTGHPGMDRAVDQFMKAARSLAAQGISIVYVGPAGGIPVDADRSPNWYHVDWLPQADLAHLMRSAHLIVTNGGSTLVQGIACGKVCIAVPIANDQVERARRCVACGVAESALLDASDIVQAVERLLQNEVYLSALAARVEKLELVDGVAMAIKALEKLVEPIQQIAQN